MALLLASLVLAGAARFSFLAWEREVARGLDGAAIARTSRGPVEYAVVGEGPPALALHGSPGGFDYFLRRDAVLTPHGAGLGFRLIAPSRPGYLDTPLDTGRSAAAQADAYAALLDRLGHGRVVVIAVSGGAPSALQFAIRHPDRCAALILISPLLKSSAPPDGWVQRVLRSDLGLWLFSPAWIAGLQRSVPEDGLVGDLARATVMSQAAGRRRDAGLRNDALQMSMGVKPDLVRIRCSTLVIHGGEDTAASPADALDTVLHIKGARLTPIVGGGHEIFITEHSRIDRAIIDFVAALPPVSAAPSRYQAATKSADRHLNQLSTHHFVRPICRRLIAEEFG